MELQSGTMVRDNLRLVRPLGEGGMGRVWVAEHLTLKTQVAVKFVLESLIGQNPELIDRFNREASTSAQIKSRHAVQVFDHGVMDDGTPYLVMELLEGETLGERLEREGTIELRVVATVLRQVARALDKAHELGIVHRDIKPDNIFLVSSEDELFVKVLDFGIAKPAAASRGKRLTVPGALVGTPEFMSREQVLTGEADFRADLWALAVVVYLALVGDIPFDGPTVAAICMIIEKGQYAPPSTVRSDLGAEVDSWFARALNAEPERRFGSAKEMAIAFLGLVPALDGQNAETWEETGEYEAEELERASSGEHRSPISTDDPGLSAAVGDDRSADELVGGEAAVASERGAAFATEPGTEGRDGSPWTTLASGKPREPGDTPGADSEAASELGPKGPGRWWARWPAWAGAAVAVILVVLGATLMLDDDQEVDCTTDSDCATGQVCVFVEDHAECVPSCKDGGPCPWSRKCDPCARAGNCPHCNVCVPACVP